MARTSDTKRRATTSSGAALAAVVLAAPGFAAPAAVQQAGQAPSIENSGSVAVDTKHAGKWTKPPMKLGAEFKHRGEYAVAGVGDGHIVFEDERGNLFYVDKSTGDQKFVSRKVFSKVEIQRVGHPGLWIKRMGGKITLLGVDQDGKVIMANKRGEKFYIDPATGDMIFVK